MSPETVSIKTTAMTARMTTVAEPRSSGIGRPTPGAVTGNTVTTVAPMARELLAP
jgi:hypothetical protein